MSNNISNITFAAASNNNSIDFNFPNNAGSNPHYLANYTFLLPYIKTVTDAIKRTIDDLSVENKTDYFKNTLNLNFIVSDLIKGSEVAHILPYSHLVFPLTIWPLDNFQSLEDKLLECVENEDLSRLVEIVNTHKEILKDTKLWERVAIKLAQSSTTSFCIWRFLKDKLKLKFQDIKNEKGNSLCHIAAESGSVEALIFLKNEGCDIYKSNERGNPPFILAASAGQFNVVEWYKMIHESAEQSNSELKDTEEKKSPSFFNTLVNTRKANIGHAAAFSRRLIFLGSLSADQFDFTAVDDLGNTLAHSLLGATFSSLEEYKKAKHIIIQILIFLKGKGLKLDQRNILNVSPFEVFKRNHMQVQAGEKIKNDLGEELEKLNQNL